METLAIPNMQGVPEIVLGNEMINSVGRGSEQIRKFFEQFRLPALDDFISGLTASAGKKSFLVFKNNKYVNVLTENIAFFYIKYESPVIMCFNKEEYFVNYSLEQLQNLLPAKQFYRLNRQYLVNFNAVKEV